MGRQNVRKPFMPGDEISTMVHDDNFDYVRVWLRIENMVHCGRVDVWDVTGQCQYGHAHLGRRSSFVDATDGSLVHLATKTQVLVARPMDTSGR